MGVWLLIGVAMAADPCGGIEVSLDQAEEALVEARLEDARVRLDEAEASFACQRVLPMQLSRFWLVEGAWYSWSRDPAAAGEAWGAVKRISPGLWNDDYGSKLRALYDETEPLAGEGTLVVRGLEGAQLMVDTEPEPSTVAQPAGLHLIQVEAEEGVPYFAQIVYLAPGQELALTPPPAPVVAPPVQEPQQPVRAKRRPVWLAVAGGAAAVATGTAVGALMQNGRMDEATTVGALDAAHRRQVGYGVTSYGAMGVSVAGLVLYGVHTR